MAEAIRTLQVDRLPVAIYESPEQLGAAAALAAREAIMGAVEAKGSARIVLATGNSQLALFRTLLRLGGVAWPKVTIFHLDEYLGIDPTHQASFPHFLRRHLLDQIDARTFHPIPSRPGDPEQACRDYEVSLRREPIDLVILGLGENGHLAFNDPPYARFDDPLWVKIVRLDEVSRRQQVGEGHFGSLDEVPTHAITLTIPALLAAERLLCIAPEARKAEAVRACLVEPISEERPGSVLRRAPHARLLLDRDSAALLEL
ncbi:MAG: 6-phosphogluconolactonase [Truepera sp.]|nr:6-phosphogluconolactonase [Truepera sp.]